jgi:HTH-type transcriptional regulator/antitoxin HipB
MKQLITTTAQIGEILRGRRKARGLSQATLASELGISQGRFSALESQPDGLTLERFLRLAKLLGLELVVEDRKAGPPKSEW